MDFEFKIMSSEQNLHNQLNIEEILNVLSSVAKGDLTRKIALEVNGSPLTGDFRRIALKINTMVGQLNTFVSEVTSVVNAVNERTENLIKLSQFLAQELQSRQDDQQKTYEELAEKIKNEKGTFQVKSEFLAALSHELRSPLNNLLILSQQLFENREGNLSPQEVESAKIIYDCGNELLVMIDDVLDTTKIKSGNSSLDLSELSFDEICKHLEETYNKNHPLREEKFSSSNGLNHSETAALPKISLKPNDLYAAFDELEINKCSELKIPNDNLLKNRQALIIDDDIRNIFALSSVLERQGMQVLSSENGKQGIEVLMSNPSIDIVLMDIMMPEMDGFEAIKIIRSMERFRDLPVFALTAKAMKGDREKCLACGANEHVTKPIDTEQFLSLLRNCLEK